MKSLIFYLSEVIDNTEDLSQLDFGRLALILYKLM